MAQLHSGQRRNDGLFEHGSVGDANLSAFNPALACVLVACVALSACGSTSRLESAAPVGVDLSGAWLFDRRESDDVRARLMPIFEKRESRLRKQERRYDDGPPLPAAPNAGGPRPADVSNVQWIWQQRRREIEALIAFASPANRLDIEQAPGARQIRIANDKGEGTRVLTPGDSSALFSAMGGFKVTSGWSDGVFTIESRGVDDNPIRVVERYALLDGGQQLELRVEARLPEVGKHAFRFVYRRAQP